MDSHSMFVNALMDGQEISVILVGYYHSFNPPGVGVGVQGVGVGVQGVGVGGGRRRLWGFQALTIGRDKLYSRNFLTGWTERDISCNKWYLLIFFFKFNFYHFIFMLLLLFLPYRLIVNLRVFWYRFEVLHIHEQIGDVTAGIRCATPRLICE